MKKHYTYILNCLLYYLLGLLGLSLALPPGYASLVWPASGLALAFALVYGPWLATSIFVGSFLANISINPKELTYATLVLPACIALGSYLQAIIGAKSLKKVLGWPFELKEHAEVYKFAFLSIIPSALVSATVGVLSLIFLKSLPMSEALTNWFVWSIGDALGILIFAPIVLSLLVKNQSIWKLRRLSLSMPMLLAFLLITILISYSKHQITHTDDELYSLKMKQYQDAVVSRLRQYESTLSDIETFLQSQSDKGITPDDFNKVATHFLRKLPGINGFSWNRYLTVDEEKAFIAQQKRYWPNFEIKNVPGFNASSDGKRVVVQFIEPMSTNSKALGLDVYSNPVRKAAMDRALKSNSSISTDIIKLVQDNNADGILIFKPVTQKDKKTPLGFVVGVFTIEAMVRSIISAQDLNEYHFTIIEARGPSDLVPFWSGSLAQLKLNSSPMKIVTGYSRQGNYPIFVSDFDFSGKNLKLIIQSKRLSLTSSHLGEISFNISLSLVALIGLFLLIKTGDTSKLHDEIRKRAEIEKELAAANLDLELKVNQRTKELSDKAKQLENSQEAEKSANQAKTDFLYTMSHEIRTPLNGIISACSLMKNTSLNAEQKEYIEVMSFSGSALLTIVNDVLDFAKIESGKLELEETEFDLSQQILDTAQSFQFSASKKGIQLNIKTVEFPYLVVGDYSKLNQVVANLVSNSIKFTKIGSVDVAISLLEKDERAKLVLKVSDTGVGIPKEALGRMFSAFSQAKSSTSREFGGTGLGLSISKRLVEAMGGTIAVDSVEDQGAVFTVSVELKKGKPKISSSTDRPSYSISNERASFEPLNLRVLVAEDNTINQKIVSKLLKSWKCEFLVVANGHEVLDALRSAEYDLILMDCQMPKMDGYEATRIIRKSPSLPNDIKIIALTANAVVGDRNKCIDAGMDDYASKPLDFQQLYDTIKKTHSATDIAKKPVAS